MQKRNTLNERQRDLLESLRQKIEDVNLAYIDVGATPVDKLLSDRAKATYETNRQTDELTKQVFKLAQEFLDIGLVMPTDKFKKFIDALAKANAELADKQFLQGLKDLLPSLEDYDAKIKEVQNGKTVLTEVEKLNAQINLLQLDILAATNPTLNEKSSKGRTVS